MITNGQAGMHINKQIILARGVPLATQKIYSNNP